MCGMARSVTIASTHGVASRCASASRPFRAAITRAPQALRNVDRTSSESSVSSATISVRPERSGRSIRRITAITLRPPASAVYVRKSFPSPGHPATARPRRSACDTKAPVTNQLPRVHEIEHHAAERATTRPVVSGMHGVVAAGHPLVSMVGMRMLLAGGNAFDAAAAAGFAAAVVEPTASYTLCGECVAMVYDARRRESVAVSGQGTAPARATIDVFRRRGLDRIPTGPGADAHLSFTVPGAVDAYLTLLETYGTKSVSEALIPALQYAERGFPMYEYMHRMLAIPETRAQFALYPPGGDGVFYPGGRAPLDLRTMGHNSARYVHLVSESLKLAFADRERYYGDVPTVPLAELLAPAYLAERAALIAPDRAMPAAPLSGTPRRAVTPAPAPAAADGTTHIAAIDGRGNMIALTPSGGVFRKSAFAPELGCTLSTRSEKFR